jgi:co-chaperonin GroES (HSP10)
MTEIIQPLGDRILLKRNVAEKVGSILLPDDAQKRLAKLRCEVIRCGPACEWGLRPGDEVIIGQYAGTWLTEEGSPVVEAEEAFFYICGEADIIAVIRNNLVEIDKAIEEENRRFN